VCSSDLTVNDACWRYWRETGQHQASSKDVGTNLEHLRRLLGKETLMVELSAALIAKAAATRAAEPRNPRDKQSAPVALSTVNRQVIEPMRRLWRRAAITWGEAMPAEPDWSALRYAEPAGRTRTLTTTEEVKFWAGLRPDYVPTLWWMTLRGFRKGEVFIKKRNIDLERGVAQVRVSKKAEGDRVTEIRLSAPEIAMLATEMARAPTPWLFTYEVQRGRMKGQRRPLTYSGLTSYLRRLIKRLELENFRIHDLRHHAATTALRQSQNLKAVQKLLRHSSITATARYAHVLDDEVVDMVAALAASRTCPEQAAGSVTPLRGKS